MTRAEINNQAYRLLKDTAIKHKFPLNKYISVSVHDTNNNNFIYLEYSIGDKKYYLQSCSTIAGETNYKYLDADIENIKIEMENLINNKVKYYNF